MELHSIKRLKGERITELAGRIDLAFDKVERIAPALSAGRDVQTKEILLSLLPVSIRSHINVAESMTQMIDKIINFLEVNPQFKLTKQDIENERKSFKEKGGAISKNNNSYVSGELIERADLFYEEMKRFRAKGS